MILIEMETWAEEGNGLKRTEEEGGRVTEEGCRGLNITVFRSLKSCGSGQKRVVPLPTHSILSRSEHRKAAGMVWKLSSRYKR